MDDGIEYRKEFICEAFAKAHQFAVVGTKSTFDSVTHQVTLDINCNTYSFHESYIMATVKSLLRLQKKINKARAVTAITE